MNNIKLLKAQAKLALEMIEPRARPGLENYISALEARVQELEASQQSFAPDVCPVCEGSNKSFAPLFSSDEPCPACNGQRR